LIRRKYNKKFEVKSMIEFPNIGLQLQVNRIAFNLFGIPIYWYGILITIGLVLGFYYAIRRAKTVGLPPEHVFDTAFAGAIGGFVGARLYYVLFNLDKYDFVTAITGIRDGGLAIYGGVIGALLTAFVYTRIRRIHLLPILDLAGPAFLIGQGIGRWGNFFNQEAFGEATAGSLPWGMIGDRIITDPAVAGIDGALVHPCFLYEFVVCAIGFVLLSLWFKHRKFDGEIFLLYIIWYGANRAWIEGLRTDSLYLGQFRISQLLSIAAVIFAMTVLILCRVRKNRPVLFAETEDSRELLLKRENEIKNEEQSRKAVKALRKANKSLENGGNPKQDDMPSPEHSILGADYSKKTESESENSENIAENSEE
jgi:phosphatidylglycerol:prolipoprotein diacylglycerol transferase